VLVVSALYITPAEAGLLGSVRLSNQAHASGANTSSSFTLTAGTTTILANVCYYNDTGPDSTTKATSVTIGGGSASFIVGAGTSSSLYADLFKVTSGFSTGAGQTVSYTLSATGTYSVVEIALDFYDGTPTFGASAAAAAASPGPATTSSIANSNGDLILSGYCTKDDFGSAPTAGTGQSKNSETDDTTGHVYYGFTTETVTGASDAQSIGAGMTANIPAIASTVVTVAASSGTVNPIDGPFKPLRVVR
jgi:hypothetical protein